MHIYTCTHIDIILLHTLYTASLLWISVRNNYIFLLMSEWKNSRHKKPAVIQPFCVLSTLNKWGWSFLCYFCSPPCSLFQLCKRSYELGLHWAGWPVQVVSKESGTASFQRVALYILTQDSTQTGLLDSISREEHEDSLNHDLRVPCCFSSIP